MKKRCTSLILAAILALAFAMTSGCGYENVKIGEIMVIKRVFFGVKGELEFREAGGQFYNFFTKDHDATYNVQTHTYEMTDAGSGSKEKVDERLEVKGRDGRPAWISAYFRYHIDREKLADIHTTVGKDYERVLIHPFIQKVAKNEATTFTTFEIYAGETRQAIAERIIDILNNGEWASTTTRDDKGDPVVEFTGARLPSQLTERGIVFEDFGIVEVDLEDEYEALVVQKQDAREREAIALRETAEAVQVAKKVEAESQADMNRRVVAAEAKKQEDILNAEAKKQTSILAAEAEKEKRVLEADGEKLAMIAQAEGILAKGKAEATAKKLNLEAYRGEGGKRFAQVEISKNLGAGIQKIYYVPADMSINTIADDFMGALTIGLPSEKK